MHRWLAHLKSFLCVSSKELAYYAVPTLKEKSFHMILIHMGINDILRDQSELEQQLVLQNMMKIAHHYKEHGVKEIVADVLIDFNESWKNLCRANGFYFVNNSNISEKKLYKNWLHLFEADKCIQANNFINSINNNNFLLKHKQNNHFW